MGKPLAARELDRAGVAYELREFEATEFTAEEVARKLDIPLTQVYKTLVARGDATGVVMAVVPGDRELDLKRLAAATGDKRIDMVKKSEVETLTGYLPGGCSPLASRKKYPLFIDAAGESLPFVSVSAGHRGMQLLVSPGELARVTGAKFAEISR